MLIDNNNQVAQLDPHVRVNEETGELYYQGERELSAFEKRYQSADGDYMDVNKIADYNTVEWEHYDFKRCWDTNCIIYDGVRPIVEEAVHRRRLDGVHPFIRAWCFPGDDVPLRHAGELVLALSLFKDEVDEFGRWQATARFIGKMIKAHARSVRNEVNFNDNTADDWVYQGMQMLFGCWDDDPNIHRESRPLDEETREDKRRIVDALRHAFSGQQLTQSLAGLRRFRVQQDRALRA